jgi:hypothetical protein
MHLGISAAGAAAAVLLLAGVATTATAQSIPPSTDPQQVVDSFELARGAGDVDGAMAELSDTAVITVENQTSTRSFTGSVQLRTYLQSIGTRFETVMRSRPIVQGSSVTWTERDQFGSQIVDATVVAIVSSGQIVALSYRDSESPTAPGMVSMASPKPLQLPSFAWAGALVGLGLLGIGLLFGWPRRKASQSQLDGRLLVALQRERDRDESERKAA